jgi:hypothetical protein
MSRGYLNNPRGPFICQNPVCGKEYKTIRPPGEGETYCSRACTFAHWKVQTTENARLKSKFCNCGTQIKHSGALCGDCRLLTNFKKSLLNKSESIKRRCAGRDCKGCGGHFTVEYKRRGAIGKYCHACRAIGDRIELFGVAYEGVNSVSVFQRDGWKCQHCGCDTTARLLGTLEQTAPSLDHILPLSHGGAHSYANTQCLCRKCNSYKGNRLDREPKLLGAVDLQPYRVAKCPGKHGRAQQPRTCACGCGKQFTPYVDGNDMYSNGHWMRIAPTTAGHSSDYPSVVAYVKRRVWAVSNVSACQ